MWRRHSISIVLFFAALGLQAQDTLQVTEPPSLTRLMLLQQEDKQEKTTNINPYILHRAFFCNMEDKLDRKSKTKFRFRLGDQATVDRLEGK